MPTAITFMAPLRTNRYRSNRIRNNRRRGNNFLLRLHRVIRRNWVARTEENPHTLLGHVAGLATQPTKNTERADLGTMTWPWPTEHWESWQEYHTRQSKPSIWIKPGISLESRVFTTRFQFCKAGKHRNNRTQHAGLPHSLTGNDPTASLISIGRSRRKTVRSLLSAGSNRRGAPSKSRPSQGHHRMHPNHWRLSALF